MGFTEITETINTADYLLDAQKKQLLRELKKEEEGFLTKGINGDDIEDFLYQTLGIHQHELSVGDNTRIRNWIKDYNNRRESAKMVSGH